MTTAGAGCADGMRYMRYLSVECTGTQGYSAVNLARPCGKTAKNRREEKYDKANFAFVDGGVFDAGISGGAKRL